MNSTPPGSNGSRTGELDRRLATLGPAQRALLEQRLRRAPLTGHRHIGDALARLGVTHVYGVPGQPVYDTFAACASAGLRLIGTRHQQPAALMAAAHNFVAGSIRAATVLSAGVPAANAVAAAVVARDNCWPLLIVAGSAARTAAGAGYFMSLDIAELFRSVTKAATCVADTCGIAAMLDEAVRLAMDGRPGPVLVEVPGDVLTGLAPKGLSTATPGRNGASAPLPSSTLARVKESLTGARRPLLVVGSGVRWAGCTAELRSLVDDFAIPYIASPNARGMLPDGHPLCRNDLSGSAQSNADVVLVLGARLNWVFRHGEQFAPDAIVIQVDIDDAETARNTRVAVGVAADAGAFLRALLQVFDEAERAQARTRRDPDWLDALDRTIRRRGGTGSAGGRRWLADLAAAPRRRDSRRASGGCDHCFRQQRHDGGLPADDSRSGPGQVASPETAAAWVSASRFADRRQAFACPARPVITISGLRRSGRASSSWRLRAQASGAHVRVVSNNDGNGGRTAPDTASQQRAASRWR